MQRLLSVDVLAKSHHQLSHPRSPADLQLHVLLDPYTQSSNTLAVQWLDSNLLAIPFSKKKELGDVHPFRRGGGGQCKPRITFPFSQQVVP